MIRQAISCDICGTEMLNANHWFVARAKGNELRISVWDPHSRLRSAKHLCGHKCLHKMLDDFTAQILNAPLAAIESQPAASPLAGIEVGGRLPAAVPIHPRQESNLRAAGAVSSNRLTPDPGAKAVPMPHSLHADAWKRERERQQTAAGKRSIA